MNIHWDSLLAVFLVSLGSAVAVVVLVAWPCWGSRPAPPWPTGPRRRRRPALAGRDGRGRRLPGGRRRDRPVRALGRGREVGLYLEPRRHRGWRRCLHRAWLGRRGSRRGGVRAAARHGGRRRHRGRVAGRVAGARRHDHLPRDQRRPRRPHHRSPGVPADRPAAARRRPGRPRPAGRPGSARRRPRRPWRWTARRCRRSRRRSPGRAGRSPATGTRCSPSTWTGCPTAPDRCASA